MTFSRLLSLDPLISSPSPESILPLIKELLCLTHSYVDHGTNIERYNV